MFKIVKVMEREPATETGNSLVGRVPVKVTGR
jgi:hypothetical protein